MFEKKRKYLKALLYRRVFLPFPLPGKVDDGSRPFYLLQIAQSLPYNGHLLGNITRFTEGMPEGPAKEERSRRFDLFRQFSQDGDGDGGDARLFYGSLYQSDRLIADASAGGEEGNVCAVLT